MDIELSKKTLSRLRRTQKLKYLFNKLIIVGGLLLSFILLGISGANLWIKKDNQRLDKRVKSTETKISAKNKVETQQVYLNSKLTSFAGLIKTHELHQELTETIFALIPTGTTLKGFEVTETGQISLSGSVPSWPLFSRLILNLKQSSGPLKVAQVTVKKIDFNNLGTVNFNFNLAINTAGVKP